MVAILWKSAQSTSRESGATLQSDTAVAVDKAKAGLAGAQLAHAQAQALQLHKSLHAQLRTGEHDVSQLRKAQATTAAIREPGCAADASPTQSPEAVGRKCV